MILGGVTEGGCGRQTCECMRMHRSAIEAAEPGNLTAMNCGALRLADKRMGRGSLARSDALERAGGVGHWPP